MKINGQQVGEYRYNSLGQRVAKLTGQGFTTYLYGPDGQLLAEADYSSAGTQQRSQAYLWLDSMPLASVEKQGSNAPRVLYLHSDHLNTPRLATSANQQILWQWQSDAFGNGAPNQDPQGLGQQMVLNLRFPGQYFDLESGLHYNYLRNYDPQTGRYIEGDPIGLDYKSLDPGIELAEGLGLVSYSSQAEYMNKLYHYTENNPINFYDIDGLVRDKYKKPENPNKRKGADERQKSGERERNVGHPEGEEHSRRPKGGIRMRMPIPFMLDPCLVIPTLCNPNWPYGDDLNC